MTALIPVTVPLRRPLEDSTIDEAELAAAAFLARYQGRTLDAYATTCGRSSSGRPMRG